MNTVRVFTWLLLTPSLLCNTGCRPSEEPPGSRTETAIESASGAAESTAAHVVAQDANDPRGNVPDPPRDLSRLTVTVGDGTLLVTDPQGRRTGINPATGEEVQEIPRSVFYRDAIDDDVTGEPATASTFFVDMEQPLQGTYQVLVTGLTGAVRNLSVTAISTDNSLQPLASVPVELRPGSTATFQVEFASFPGAVTRIRDENGDTTAHVVAEDANHLRDHGGGSTDPQQEFSDERPVFSPDGTHIAFQSNRGGTYNIWMMDRDGENLRQISHLSWDMQPSWSPDGQRIAFASYGETMETRRFAVWIINVAGTGARRLIEPAGRGDHSPCWFPVGDRLAWTHGRQLWIADSQGQGARPLTTRAAKVYGYCGAWSPDGELIAYLAAAPFDSSASYIWLIKADGEDQHMVSSGIRAYNVRWSRDGLFLYYNTHNEIMKVAVHDPGEPETIFAFDSPFDIFHFDISPDEKWVAFADPGPHHPGRIHVKSLLPN